MAEFSQWEKDRVTYAKILQAWIGELIKVARNMEKMSDGAASASKGLLIIAGLAEATGRTMLRQELDGLDET